MNELPKQCSFNFCCPDACQRTATLTFPCQVRVGRVGRVFLCDFHAGIVAVLALEDDEEQAA